MCATNCFPNSRWLRKSAWCAQPRGMLSRPSVGEIAEYRRIVDKRVEHLMRVADARALEAIANVVELGIAHEQQHQELLLTDILHVLHQNPLRPPYRSEPLQAASPTLPRRTTRFLAFAGGLVEIGAKGDTSFRFDNEEPRHRIFLEPYQLANRLVTVGEWKAFADERGYQTPSLWLADGYEWARANHIHGPMYSTRDGSALVVFGFHGPREARDDEPIVHLCYYEADAIARFHRARLPTEAEWENAAASAVLGGNFLDDDVLHPLPARGEDGMQQMFGDAWQWTASPYVSYPGFVTPKGAIGEYNAKFMVNQIVLRGGSCLTPAGHVRATYRNFWSPETRFQMTGMRLARSGPG